MKSALKKEDLRAFAERRWDLLEVEKDRARARRYRDGGASAAHAAAVALHEHFYAIHGDPSPQRRQADFEHHVELRRKLDRARRAFAQR